MQDISRKNDLVVWLRMTPLQLQIYKVSFLNAVSNLQSVKHTSGFRVFPPRQLSRSPGNERLDQDHRRT